MENTNKQVNNLGDINITSNEHMPALTETKVISKEQPISIDDIIKDPEALNNISISRMDYGEEVIIDDTEAKISKIIDIASNQGVFNQGVGCLPVVSEQTNYNICAGIKHSKQNKIIICLQFDYKDGRYSELFEFPQCDLIKWVNEQNRITDIYKNQKMPRIADKNNRNISKNKYAKVYDKFYDTIVSYIDPCKIKLINATDIKTIIMDIYNNYEQLVLIEKVPNIKEAYTKIICYLLKNKNNINILHDFNGKSTFRIIPEHFKPMASEIGYNHKDLIQLLKTHNMLYLTPSSTAGGLTKVRILGDPTYCYCIKKLNGVITNNKNNIPEIPNNHNITIETDTTEQRTLRELLDMFKTTNLTK